MALGNSIQVLTSVFNTNRSGNKEIGSDMR